MKAELRKSAERLLPAGKIYLPLAQAVRISAAFGFQKLITITYGAAGLAVLGYLQSLLQLGTALQNDGLNRALIKSLSNTNDNGTDISSIHIIWHFYNLIILGILAGIFINFKGYLPAELLYLFQLPYFTVIVFAGVFFFSISYWQQSILIATNRNKLYFYSIALPALLQFLSGVWAFYAQPAINNLLSIWILIYITSLIIYIHKFKIIPISIKLIIEHKNLLKYVGTALSVFAFSYLIQYYIRIVCIDEIGLTATGYWQAIQKISEASFFPLNFYLYSVYFPQVSGGGNRFSVIKTRSIIYRVSALYWVGIFILALLAKYVLVVLYSDSFFIAQPWLRTQHIGDAFRVPAYILSTWIMARGFLKTTVLLEALSAVFYIFLIFIPEIISIEYLVNAHVYRYVFFLIITLIAYKVLANKK